MTTSISMSISDLRQSYRAGLDPLDLVREVHARIKAQSDNPVWIHVLSMAELAPLLARLKEPDAQHLPLFGIPFAIKDNIDLAGVPTTAACPAFEYVPETSAFVVDQLIAAGAIPIGKTNLDQFATGLVGTRSPYGAVRNAFDERYISGGSSAGSAVAVALGQVSFALGTDTAGSGRVPAAFNNLVGYKPTRGLLSATGVVPACRTLDAVSVFALTVLDAETVMQQAVAYDAADCYARVPVASMLSTPVKRIGVPTAPDLEFFGDDEYQQLFAAAVRLAGNTGFELVEVDISPLLAAARLLYEGAWVAERRLAVGELMNQVPDVLRPEIRAILEPADSISALDYFKGAYALAAHRRFADALFRDVDAVLVPTTPTHFTLAEIEADPLVRNARLGHYTNFMNLLDLCGVALPAGFTNVGLPFGVTLIGDAMSDARLLAAARKLLSTEPRRLGATGALMNEPLATPDPTDTLAIAVCGAHLTGMPLNGQLSERGARLREVTSTAPAYKLFALPGGPPFRPGLVRAGDGAAIEVEVFERPLAHVGSFLAGIPAPLGLGRLELASGEWVTGFICEPCGIEGAKDITSMGGWRAFMASK